jgi:hypothetical protein
MTNEELANTLRIASKSMRDENIALAMLLMMAAERIEEIDTLVAAEREACAKECEIEASVIVVNASEEYQEGRSMGATVCYHAIQARSKNEAK